MGMNYELDRHIEAAKEAENTAGVNALEAQKAHFNSLRDAGTVQELPLETRLTESTQPATRAESVVTRIELTRSPLDQAVAEYNKSKTHTPEFLTNFQRVLWGQLSEIAGVDVVVPVIAQSEQNRIAESETRGKGVSLIPQGYEGQDKRRLIGAAFKLVGNKYVPDHWSVVDGNSVKNDIVHVGYRLVDMQINAPNLKTDEGMARDLMKKGKPEEGSEGMNESEYLIGALQSKLLTGQYLDQGSTWSRLLSSSDGGQVVRARFHPGGALFVHSYLGPEDRRDGLGARFSSGVKTA